MSRKRSTLLTAALLAASGACAVAAPIITAEPGGIIAVRVVPAPQGLRSCASPAIRRIVAEALPRVTVTSARAWQPEFAPASGPVTLHCFATAEAAALTQYRVTFTANASRTAARALVAPLGAARP